MASTGVTSTAIEFGGNRYRTILKLALPTVIAMLSQSVVNDIDVVFFSRLPSPEGSNGQAALLPSLIVVWLFGGSLSAISVGTQALTARRFAEGDKRGAGAVLTNAAWFCLLAGAVGSVLGYFTLPLILGFMLKKPEVLAMAVAYSRWRLLGIISMAMTMGIKSFFDGIGKTHVHLVAAIVMNAFNVFACWVFIYGHLGMPRMGPPGAGLSAFISTWIGLAIMLAYARGESRVFPVFEREQISRTLTWSILKLSIPAALATVTMMIGFGLFSSIVGKLDAIDVAHAKSLGLPPPEEAVNGAATTDVVAILKLTFTACIAFGTATATLVGQSLGAKKPDEASAYGWASVRLGFGLFAVLGVCEGLFFTREIVQFISHSDSVREAAMIPMRMMGAVTPIIAVAMILSEALFGAGNPKFVAAAQFVLIFLCLVPVAYLLAIAMHVGLLGIWIATSIYATLAAVTMSVKFYRGSWKNILL